MYILACRGALTAQGSRRTRGGARLDVAFRFHNNVGTLNGLISQLHTSPTSAPVNASPLPLRPDTHDSGNSVVRYTFTIWDLHPLCIASSPGALWTRAPFVVPILGDALVPTAPRRPGQNPFYALLCG